MERPDRVRRRAGYEGSRSGGSPWHLEMPHALVGCDLGIPEGITMIRSDDTSRSQAHSIMPKTPKVGPHDHMDCSLTFI